MNNPQSTSPHPQSIDQATMWSIPQLDDLRFIQALYVRHAFKPHSHDYYVIGMIEQGVQSFTYYRQRLVTIPGKLIVINPGEMHTGEARVPAGFAYRGLYPSANLMQGIARELTPKFEHLPDFSGGVIDDPALYYQILSLHHRSQQAVSSLELEESLTAFFVELIRRYAVGKSEVRSYQDAGTAILQVRDYLEAHYAEPITLSELSNLVYISPFHLARLFQRQIGVPPHKYLESVRVRHAEHFLNQGMTIVDAAIATGFSSQSHLTRTFKHFIGVTPGQFAGQRKII
ncbi:MAG TPA: AraC family transcriptional regulator [Phototrophicaceae bacterium]|jgi:AraC-like DNA-binding protein|nr:AraC family transcriptional regulator [Phototrophicaceae bacterium]